MGIAAKTPDLVMTQAAEKTVEAIDFAGTTTSFIQYTNNFFKDLDLRTYDNDADAAITGNSMTMSFWFKLDSIVNTSAGVGLINVMSSTTTQRYRVHLTVDTTTDPDDIRLVFIYHDDNSNLHAISTTNGEISLNTWYHVLISVKADVSGTIVLNDTPVTTTAQFAGDVATLPIATTDTFVGTQHSYNPIEPPNLDGQLAEIWMDDKFYDISGAAGRRFFISANGKPVHLPSNPLVYLNGNHTTWTNDGTSDLGTQTLNNITTSSTSPSD